MNIQFDEKSSKKFFGWLAAQMLEHFLPEFKKLLEQEVESDKLLTKGELCEMLRTTYNSVDEFFINKPGFPYIPYGDQKRFSRKAVEKWIQENTKYN